MYCWSISKRYVIQIARVAIYLYQDVVDPDDVTWYARPRLHHLCQPQ